MRPPKYDLTGMTFNALKVTRMELGKKGYDAICDCLECGKNNHRVRAYDLKNGRFKTCGCKAKFIQNIQVGDKFGYLEVISLCKEIKNYKNKKYQYSAICKCHNCGQENFKVRREALKAGRTTSCGCRRDQYSKITGENSSQFKGYKEIRGTFWNKIKLGAKERGIKFSISIKQAWDLYESQARRCALTGLPIFFGRTSSRRETTASLDRINSSKGYEVGNVQWVTKDINVMKRTLLNEEFLEICKLVVNYKGKIND